MRVSTEMRNDAIVQFGKDAPRARQKRPAAAAETTAGRDASQKWEEVLSKCPHVRQRRLVQGKKFTLDQGKEDPGNESITKVGGANAASGITPRPQKRMFSPLSHCLEQNT